MSKQIFGQKWIILWKKWCKKVMEQECQDMVHDVVRELPFGAEHLATHSARVSLFIAECSGSPSFPTTSTTMTSLKFIRRRRWDIKITIRFIISVCFTWIGVCGQLWALRTIRNLCILSITMTQYLKMTMSSLHIQH